MRSEVCTIVRNGCWDGNNLAKLLVFMDVEIFIVIDCDTTNSVGVVWASVSIVVGRNIEVVVER